MKPQSKKVASKPTSIRKAPVRKIRPPDYGMKPKQVRAVKKPAPKRTRTITPPDYGMGTKKAPIGKPKTGKTSAPKTLLGLLKGKKSPIPKLKPKDKKHLLQSSLLMIREEIWAISLLVNLKQT